MQQDQIKKLSEAININRNNIIRNCNWSNIFILLIVLNEMYKTKLQCSVLPGTAGDCIFSCDWVPYLIQWDMWDVHFGNTKDTMLECVN